MDEICRTRPDEKKELCNIGKCVYLNRVKMFVKIKRIHKNVRTEPRKFNNLTYGDDIYRIFDFLSLKIAMRILYPF